MGSIAASLLLKKIEGGKIPELSRVDPELVVRESTGKVASKR
jgi:DNA-binding LacI/PurR family transcriptional regulator